MIAIMVVPQQRLPRAQRREQLLTVATRVFAEGGYRTTSMDMIAEAAGVSKPVLYQHFDSKQDLYLALIKLAATSLSDTIQAGLSSTEDNEERIFVTLRAYFDFVVTRRHEFVMLFNSDFYEPQAHRLVESIRDEAAKLIAEVIAEFTTRSAADVDTLANAIVGLAENVAVRLVTAEAPDPIATATLISQFVWNGISSFSVPATTGAAGAGG